MKQILTDMTLTAMRHTRESGYPVLDNGLPPPKSGDRLARE